MNKDEFLRIALEMDESTLRQALQNKGKPNFLYFYGFGRSKQEMRDRFGQYIDKYGKTTYDTQFTGNNEEENLYVYRMVHLADDRRRIIDALGKCGMPVLPEVVTGFPGYLVVNKEKDDVILRYRKRKNEHSSWCLLKAPTSSHRILIDFAEHLVKFYDHEFEDLSIPAHPSLIYISEEDAPSMIEAHWCGESFDVLLDDVFSTVANNEISERTFYYSSGLNHYAIYLPSQISDNVKSKYVQTL